MNRDVQPPIPRDLTVRVPLSAPFPINNSIIVINHCTIGCQINKLPRNNMINVIGTSLTSQLNEHYQAASMV